MFSTVSETRQWALAQIGVLPFVVLLLAGLSCAVSGQPKTEDDAPAPGTPDKPGDTSPGEQDNEQAAALHRELLMRDGPYLSAAACQQCHPGHYDEWSVSPHAYAQLSPVFNAMHGKILKLTNGTNGDFCIRCHSPVGMELEEPLFVSNLDRHPVSREGITCIVCHRLKRPYGKVSARFALERGDIFAPIYGPRGNEILKGTLGTGKLATSREGAGRPVHGDITKLDHLRASSFCGICHDVTLMNGFRLEEAFSEYKTSPAAARGVSCQDCHMGYEPGVPDSYHQEPAAVVKGLEFPERRRTNHRFIGPDYSVIHPALFPHRAKAIKINRDDQEGRATMHEWLDFDWKAGWGTDEFEQKVKDNPKAYEFPAKWKSRGVRKRAHSRVISKNLELLAEAQKERNELLRLAYQLGEIVPISSDETGIRFKIELRNGTDGHGVPTGFDAERLVFLQVTVTDREGRVVMQSGDLDPNGDVRDLHSIYVHNHELPLDSQLFSLQSKFITRNVRGGEREQVLAVNTSLSPLPFLRPARNSTILTGRSGGARKHKQNIAPNDSRWATYTVAGSALTGQGPYTAEVNVVAGMVPVNLIHEIMDVGFDYGMSPRAVADAVVYGLDGKIAGPEDSADDYGGHTILHKRVHTFCVNAD